MAKQWFAVAVLNDDMTTSSVHEVFADSPKAAEAYLKGIGLDPLFVLNELDPTFEYPGFCDEIPF